jgi:hypothetical protein
MFSSAVGRRLAELDGSRQAGLDPLSDLCACDADAGPAFHDRA